MDVKKLAIVGDLHFGVRNNSQQYLRYQSEWIENELKSITDKHKCESVIFLGDVLDNRVSLSPLILKEVRRLFKLLAERYENVFVLLGNHDIYYRNTRDVHSLEFLQDQGVVLIEDPLELEMGSKKSIILPWLTKDDEDVHNKLVSNKYDYCFGHLEINNFEMIKNVVEKDGLRQDLFDNCGRVFSGHFHLRREAKQISYVGTPYEMDWGDYGETKGVTVLDIESGKETFVETKKAPIHVRLNTKDTKLSKVTKKIISNNFVQLKFHEGITEVERIDFIEKINSLEPLTFSTDEGDGYSFDTDDSTLDSSIKDTMGFLTEYIDLVGVPEELDKKVVLEKLNVLHEKIC